MNHDSPVRDTIVRLLSNIGSAREIQQYLKRFSQRDASRFAVVKVGGAILRDDLEALVSSLGFLQQVGLTPIVIHGAGPQLDAELAAKRRGQTGEAPDRLEREKIEFFEAARKSYLDLAKAEPGRFFVVNANQDPQSIWNEIKPRLDQALESQGL